MSRVPNKVVVLCDGGWGTALATLLCQNQRDVTLWGPFPEHIIDMRANGENKRFLPGVKLPESLALSENVAIAADADVILLASPSQYARSILETFKPHHRPDQIILNVAKGIENHSLKRMSELCAEVLGPCRYAILSGPSHAEEVAIGSPTAVVAAAEDTNLARAIQDLFMNRFFRVYTCADVVSVELGGALKNVYAIAAGLIDGMRVGDNAKAALITRAVAEMGRLGAALGGNPETFSGLSGIGDLIVTCFSGHSRNRRVGEELGSGKTLDEILEGMGMVVAEGVKTSESARALAQREDVLVPIIDQVHAILYEGKAPDQALNDLMTRKARPEKDVF